jgi:hypothetical protein
LARRRSSWEALLLLSSLCSGEAICDGELPTKGSTPSPQATICCLMPTRAVTVRAAAADVWPWIAQLGQGRGGFYSYDVLENLIGCDIHSADQIVSEWQAIDLGAELKLHPAVGLIVVGAEPGRALVLRGGIPMGKTPPPYDFTWAFVLGEEPGGTTRLVVRERYVYSRWWASFVVEPAELISFVMSQRMLRGIRERAEREGS